MDHAESVAARLIGTVFIERGLASEEQVQEALALQQETGHQLGEILVQRFGVSRTEMARVVAEHRQAMGRPGDPGLGAAVSESWKRLGEIFVDRGFVTKEQLDRALSRQRQTGERLGEALVALGAITKFELAGALAEQMAILDEASPEGDREMQSGTVVALPARPAVPGAIAPAWEHGSVADTQPEDETWDLDAGAAAAPRETRSLLTVRDPDCVAFVSTATGYVLVPLDGAPPQTGETVSLDGLGELVVLRHAPSPLPLDRRTCVILERSSVPVLSFSFAD